MKKIRAFFVVCLIALVAIILFIIIFPLLHNSEVLDPKEAAPGGKFITLKDGSDIHYYDEGSGRAIVMIHGFAASADAWGRNAPAFSGRYRVVRPDLAGFGYSVKPHDVDYSYRFYADHVIEMMDRMKIKQAVLIGNSMGGGVSLRMAMEHPKRVSGLVLVDTVGIDHGMNIGLKLMATPGINNFMSSVNNRFFMKLILRRMIFEDKSLATEAMADKYLTPFRTYGAMGAAAKVIRSIKTDFTDEEFENIKVPTLIIWGEKDRVIYPAIATALHMKMPESKLVMIPKCGHCPQEEVPEEFNRLVSDFLSAKNR
ncbi:MAG TPA: alpha/beta hydrolase [bacterium]|nr:alpha/beta hydrolase [bacterium]